MKNTISNLSLGGERPLSFISNTELLNIKITDGESAIKECCDLAIHNSVFCGKYPLWHLNRAIITNSVFTENSRAAVWYSNHLDFTDCKINAKKIFRKVQRLKITNCIFTDADETLWDCNETTLENCMITGGGYLFLNSSNIIASNCKFNVNYSFQNCKNIHLMNCDINSKDAFWETENVVLENCRITGEYIAWHSNNLKMVNCTLDGTQPLCYANSLQLKNCSMKKTCDLAFEYSSVNADVNGYITSIKNPLTGNIKADHIGTIIIDSNDRSANRCIITQRYIK